jgi:hypothetical protein
MRDNKDGTALTTYRFALQFLKSALQSDEFKLMDGLVQRSAKTIMNAIEYSVSVGVIFNETFMNKDVRLTRANIDEMEQTLYEFLRFFSRWMQEIVSKTTKENKAEMDSKFMSRITYSNLRTGIAGFCEYARIVFQVSPETTYVPFLHSNTSTLEALFSQLRSMNRDSPERYISGLAAVNTHHAVLALKRNKMYDTDQIGELTSVDAIQGLTKWRDNERQQMVDCWRASNIPIQVDSPKFPIDFHPSHGTQDLLDVMKRDVVRGGYFQFVTTNKLFKLYALTSVFTSNESAFEELFKLNQAGQQEFELICQEMVGNLYHLQESSICGKGVSNSFHFQVLTFLQTRQELTSQEHIYKPSRPCAIILFHVLSIIFKDWVKDALTELSFQKRETIRSTSDSLPSTMDSSSSQDRLVVECTPVPLHPTMNRQDENREVTDFFGWAIYNLRHVLSREYERMKELRWDTACTMEEEKQMISFLDDMRIFHTQAILDEEYLRDMYPPCHQLKNKGWLSLVSKPFFPFARHLLHQIRLTVDVNEWRRRGNGVIETAAKALEENESLTVLFLDAAKTSSLDEKWKRKIMSALILKVLHARSAAEHDKYKEQHTNREAKGATASSFRGELKVLTKGAHNNNKVKRQKTKQ